MLNQRDQSSNIKRHYRQQTWDYMMKNDLVNFPSRVYKRIPNFKGAEEAAKRLSELDEFKNAKVIKINPDKPQEPVRLLALEAEKEILVPIPRLKSGLFYHVVSSEVKSDDLKVVATRDGLQEHGKPIGVDAKIKVDLVVLGAVCVSPEGYRIGKGEGFADLEFAMMMRMGAITDETIVATTIHDSQLIDNLEPEIFKKHDVPVDIIVTPTKTIIVNEKLRKPVGIFWDILTQRRVKSVQILQQLKLMDEKEGKDVVLRKDEPPRYGNNYSRSTRGKKNNNPKHDDSTTKVDNDGDDEDKNMVKEKGDVKRRATRRRQPRKQQQTQQKDTNDENSPETEVNTKIIDKSKEKNPRRKTPGSRPKPQIDFSLKLSNISSNVRVRDLKNALAERGVRPTDIAWRGQRGFCYIHFGKLRNKDSEPNQPVQVDSIVANLQQLRIGENNEDDFIIVEPAKPITRIEITDVTSV
ncbi:hypothetical protein PV325_003132 [Microctonus aethiopoides]|uniref:Methenyltetrahydrofolate synthase domain-containing protein n=1 Tax=Microctonus aethiopoides TaxID=144406 RepID=A0AA39F902_9HYME|nr:hypothetical protein PV325_003132 [Microctonus aethiopoides]KAK0099169.1 hypothetical protein PV326_000006 [Microctonus aethiopoides]KAK0165187.1 hypothetical protein PV328_003729 [Microctonus aethiopoides]